jgi:hypothetical protein
MFDAIPDRPVLPQDAIRSEHAFDEVFSDPRALFDRHGDVLSRYLLLERFRGGMYRCVKRSKCPVFALLYAIAGTKATFSSIGQKPTSAEHASLLNHSPYNPTTPVRLTLRLYSKSRSRSQLRCKVKISNETPTSLAFGRRG